MQALFGAAQTSPPAPLAMYLSPFKPAPCRAKRVFNTVQASSCRAKRVFNTVQASCLPHLTCV